MGDTPAGAPQPAVTLDDLSMNQLSALRPPSNLSLGGGGRMVPSASSAPAAPATAVDATTWDRARRLWLVKHFLGAVTSVETGAPVDRATSELNSLMAMGGALRGDIYTVLQSKTPLTPVSPTPALVAFLKEKGSLSALAAFVAQDPDVWSAEEEEEDREAPKYAKTWVFPRVSRPPPQANSEVVDEWMILAWRAQDLLSRSDRPPALDDALRARGEELVGPLFRVFRCADSRASVFHVCAVLDRLVKAVPDVVTTYLAAISARTKRIFESLLENAHFSPVACLLVELHSIRGFSIEEPQKGGCRDADALQRYRKRITQTSWLVVAAKRVAALATAANPPSPATSVEPERCVGLANFVRLTLERLSGTPRAPHNEADSFEAAMLKPLTAPAVVKELVLAAARVDRTTNSLACVAIVDIVEALTEIATNARLSSSSTGPPPGGEGPDGGGAGGDIDGMAEGGKTPTPPARTIAEKRAELARLRALEEAKTKAEFVNRLAPMARDLKAVFSDMGNTDASKSVGESLARTEEADARNDQLRAECGQHSTYVVDVPLTHRRLVLLRALLTMVSSNPKDRVPSLLATRLPWELMVKWQARHPNSSLLQGLFAEAFQMAVMAPAKQMDAAQDVLVKRGVLQHLCARLTSAESATDHAHVVKCCNLVRLRGEELEASGEDEHWLVELLRTSAEWDAVQSRLARATRMQLEPLLERSSSGVGVLDDEVDGPAQALQKMFLSDPTNPLTAVSAEFAAAAAVKEVTDISLGSAFAKSLGFVAGGSQAGKGKGKASKPGTPGVATAAAAASMDGLDDLDDWSSEDEDNGKGGSGAGGKKKPGSKKKKGGKKKR